MTDNQPLSVRGLSMTDAQFTSIMACFVLTGFSCACLGFLFGWLLRRNYDGDYIPDSPELGK